MSASTLTSQNQGGYGFANGVKLGGQKCYFQT